MRWLAAFLLFLAGIPAGEAAPAPPALLPSPASIVTRGDGFSLRTGTPLIVSDAEGAAAAARLVELMAGQRVPLRIVRGASRARVAVRFVHAPELPAEGYRLTTGLDGATIAASDRAGMIHGAVTLWQLATQQGTPGQVTGVTIVDQPRFAWRGLMLDSARHFQSPAFVKRTIDWMMANKLNRLHWHLVDDQGWRLPVPGWPKLTTVSAWRRDATAPGAPPQPVTGGFYTEAEIREIVAYADARGVTIVPEIEMPGHALAAIRAYPRLGMGVPIPLGTESDWGVFPWLYNTDEGTFRFLEAVLDQTMRLFPGAYVHVGGDEAVKDQWKASPAIQTQIKALGLKDEDALQGWFVARIGRYLAAHGRRLVGWDETLDGAVPPDATITSWRGVDGAIKAAKLGHDAILSPAPTLYLDNRQGTGPEEPPGRGKTIALADVLAFDPMPASLTPAQRRHIIGVQANLWTEHVRTEARAAWMMWPRGAALAEIGWGAAARRDVTGFAAQLLPEVERMRPLGLVAADSLWAVSARLNRTGSGITATLANQVGWPMRYTLDGSTPAAGSARYDAPVAMQPGQRLRAVSLLGARAAPGAYDRIVTLADALTRTSRELTLCSEAVPLDLEDDYPATGARAHFLLDIFHPCWRWDAAPVASARTIALSVGQVPFNFQVGADRNKIAFKAPATPAGEFEVHDRCDGPLLATLPLAPAVRNPGVTRLTGALLPRASPADLCITYTARGVDPLWAIDRVELLP